jgi:hypothetical protein
MRSSVLKPINVQRESRIAGKLEDQPKVRCQTSCPPLALNLFPLLLNACELLVEPAGVLLSVASGKSDPTTTPSWTRKGLA